jgi:ankyrin repeat protein
MNSIDEALLHAAASCDLAGVKRALSKGASVEAQLDGGSTALHLAVLKRRPDIALALLGVGANIHAQDIQGRTPLSIARSQENFRAVMAASDRTRWVYQ